MADYASWDEELEKVTELELDPKNPRIPPGLPEPVSQRALIHELVDHDKVFALAQDIAERGYIPVESLVGVKKDGKKYIVEGNRRLAALKLLISPEMAPEKSIAKFRALAKAGNKPQRVRVLYAPSREAAAPLILQRHTREQIERWSVLMQARFYRSLVTSGEQLPALAVQYGVTVDEIKSFLRTDEMYQIACAMELSPEVRKKVRDSRSFPGSLLQRIIGYPRLREALGIEFDSSGRVKGTVNKEEFKKGYSRVLGDIALDVMNSRTLNSAADADQYVKTMGSDKPDRSKKGSFGLGDFSGGRTTTGTSGGTPGPRPKTKGRSGSNAIPSGIKCAVSSRRIKEVFDELRRLKVDKFPNACAVLLRILLELCVYHHMDKTGKLKPILAKARDNENKKKDWSPSLRQMLNPLLEDSQIEINPLALKRIRKLMSDQNSPLSLDDLDSFVHNKYTMPTVRDIHNLWETLEDLFKLLLVEPKQGKELDEAV